MRELLQKILRYFRGYSSFEDYVDNFRSEYYTIVEDPISGQMIVVESDG